MPLRELVILFSRDFHAYKWFIIKSKLKQCVYNGLMSRSGRVSRADPS